MFRLMNGNTRKLTEDGYMDTDPCGNIVHILHCDQDGYPHNKKGPSIFTQRPWSTETMYHKHGVLHRLDGPAIEYVWVENGRWVIQREYYINGIRTGIEQAYRA